MKGSQLSDKESTLSLQSTLKLHLSPGRYHRLMQVIGCVSRAKNEDCLSDARDVIVAWLKKKGWSLSDAQIKNERPVHLEDESSTRALSIESAPKLWAVRLDDPCNQVAGRQWRVELVLVDKGEDQLPVFGCTLSVLVPAGGTDFMARPGVPGVVGMMARSQGLQDAGHLLDGRIVEVDRPRDIDQLIKYIESKSRHVSIVVVSLPKVGEPFYDPAKLGDRLAGLAIVVAVSVEAAQEVSSRYGRSLGIFGDAIRVFRVGFDPDVDSKFRHPLFLAQSWKKRSAAVLSAISSISMADTVIRRDEQRDFPSFGVIRAIAADQRIKSVIGKNIAEEVESSQISADIATLRENVESWERYALEEDQRAKDAEEAKNQALARLYVYANRIRQLENELKAFRKERLIAFDKSLDQIAEWAEEHFAGRIIITPRALRAATAVAHADTELIYRCLSLLATEYWEMKTSGGIEHQTKCKDAESALGVRISPSGDAVDIRKYEDEYKVLWEGRSYKLDMHLAGSDSRDKRRGLRIYFSWDSEQDLVVVGHLPTHLTNAHT